MEHWGAPRNRFSCGKAIGITYSECVSVAMGIQTAKRMRRVILSSVACPAVQYFYTLSHKRHDCGGKVIEYEMYVLIFSTAFVWNIRLATVINYSRSSYKLPVILSDFNEAWIFFRKIFEKFSTSEFLENPYSGSRVVPWGRTDRPDEANSRSSQFYERAWKTLGHYLKVTGSRNVNNREGV
jgi:hypothetical protein